MKKFNHVMVLFVWLFYVVAACSKDDLPADNQVVNPPPPPPPPTSTDEETPPPTAPPSAGSAPYSGEWEGTGSVKDVNPDLCTFTDKTLPIRQSWTVIGDSVQVAETIVYSDGAFTYYWRGVIRKDTLDMISKRRVNCFGDKIIRQMTLKAPIASLTNEYRAQATTVYNMCEPYCTFEFTYQLSKKK